MNVRHDAPIEVTLLDGQRVIGQDVVEARLVNAHLTVQAYCHGGVSGMVNWNDRGRALSRAPKVRLRLTDESFELAEGELCGCDECKERS